MENYNEQSKRFDTKKLEKQNIRSDRDTPEQRRNADTLRFSDTEKQKNIYRNLLVFPNQKLLDELQKRFNVVEDGDKYIAEWKKDREKLIDLLSDIKNKDDLISDSFISSLFKSFYVYERDIGYFFKEDASEYNENNLEKIIDNDKFLSISEPLRLKFDLLINNFNNKIENIKQNTEIYDENMMEKRIEDIKHSIASLKRYIERYFFL